MATILAIDTGSAQSGFAHVTTDMGPTLRAFKYGIEPNTTIRKVLSEGGFTADLLALEMIASYGMGGKNAGGVAQVTYDTCVWIGLFAAAWERCTSAPWILVKRGKVKMHMCHAMNAKDPNLTATVCDRWKMDMRGCKGTKKNPGPLYGIKGDAWQALALAIAVSESEMGTRSGHDGQTMIYELSGT